MTQRSARRWRSVSHMLLWWHRLSENVVACVFLLKVCVELRLEGHFNTPRVKLMLGSSG